MYRTQNGWNRKYDFKLFSIFILFAIPVTRKTLVRSEVFVFLHLHMNVVSYIHVHMYVYSFFTCITWANNQDFEKTLNMLEMALFCFVFLLGPVNFSSSFGFAFLLCTFIAGVKIMFHIYIILLLLSRCAQLTFFFYKQTTHNKHMHSYIHTHTHTHTHK